MSQFPDNKKAKADHLIHKILINRWSPRSFSDQSVSREIIQSILEAGRWSASSYNEQPWRIVLGIKGDEGAYQKILTCLDEFNQFWASSAPVLMLTFAKKHFGDDPAKKNRHFWHDIGTFSASMTFQATEMGLYVHQMAGIEYEKIIKEYNIPDSFEPVSALALGYLGDPHQLPERLQGGEIAERSRKLLPEFVFGKDFGQASEFI